MKKETTLKIRKKVAPPTKIFVDMKKETNKNICRKSKNG
jgi:hypothetical protein